MLRSLLRRSVPALVLILTLSGAVPAVAAPAEDPWRGFWNWLVNLWMADEASEGDRGLELDPDGLTVGDRGLELDPNGVTSEGDRGPGADPDGLTSEGDRGLEADPNG